MKQKIGDAYDELLRASEAEATSPDETIEACDAYLSSMKKLHEMCSRDAPFYSLMDAESARKSGGSYYYDATDDQEDEYDEDGDYIGPAQPKAGPDIPAAALPKVGSHDGAGEDAAAAEQVLRVKTQANIDEPHSAEVSESALEEKQARLEMEMHRWRLRNQTFSGLEEPAVKVAEGRTVLTEKIDGSDTSILMRLFANATPKKKLRAGTAPQLANGKRDWAVDKHTGVVTSAAVEKRQAPEEKSLREDLHVSLNDDQARDRDAVISHWSALPRRLELEEASTTQRLFSFLDSSRASIQDAEALNWGEVSENSEMSEDTEKEMERDLAELKGLLPCDKDGSAFDEGLVVVDLDSIQERVELQEILDSAAGGNAGEEQDEEDEEEAEAVRSPRRGNPRSFIRARRADRARFRAAFHACA